MAQPPTGKGPRMYHQAPYDPSTLSFYRPHHPGGYGPQQQRYPTPRLTQLPRPRQSSQSPSPAPDQAGPPTISKGKCPTTVAELYELFGVLQDEVMELRHENYQLTELVNMQSAALANFDANLDSLDQYSRRENVCFTNLLIDSTHSCEDQIVSLCNELGADVTSDDLVAAHPLPGKKNSKTSRYIARFKNRSKAQEVLAKRKQTKTIDPAKKKALFADPARGVAVQPNITAKRAALLAQVKDAAAKCNLNSHWVDPKNCNIMLRVNPNGRPSPIMNTLDLIRAVPNYVPDKFWLCVSPQNLNNAECFSPVG